MNRNDDGRTVVLLHDEVAPDAPPDVADGLIQSLEVKSALERLGFRAHCVAVGPDLGMLVSEVSALRPALVFNLVESFQGDGSRIHIPAAVLDTLSVPCTGARAVAHLCTGDKRIAKQLLAAAGLPTPRYVTRAGDLASWAPDRVGLVKPATEDASVGIDSASVATGPVALARELRARQQRFGGEWLVEEFVTGREFNASVLWSTGGPQVLPIAEIEFIGFAPDRPRIVDYDAKWRTDSFAYRNTPRRFPSGPRDRPLLAQLARLALACHAMFPLGGYSRVDFRVDERGQPYILEVNANPCLSADAGFMAAAGHAGIDGDAVIARIVEAAGVREPARDRHSPAMMVN